MIETDFWVLHWNSKNRIRRGPSREASLPLPPRWRLFHRLLDGGLKGQCQCRYNIMMKPLVEASEVQDRGNQPAISLDRSLVRRADRAVLELGRHVPARTRVFPGRLGHGALAGEHCSLRKSERDSWPGQALGALSPVNREIRSSRRQCSTSPSTARWSGIRPRAC